MITHHIKYLALLSLATISHTYGGRVYTNCTTPGMVAITFDDGPHPTRTSKVLDILKTYDVKATFFYNGIGFWETNLTSYIETVQRTFQEGHQIGSHTWSHPNMTLLTRKEMRQELSVSADWFYEILKVNLTIFRPPFGDFNQDLLQLAKEEFNYEVITWNIDTRDWDHPGKIAQSLEAYFIALEERGSASYIALHHEVHLGSATLAEAAIRLMKAEGFNFVTIAECIGIPIYQQASIKNCQKEGWNKDLDYQHLNDLVENNKFIPFQFHTFKKEIAS